MGAPLSREDNGGIIDLEEIQEITNEEPVVDTSTRHETHCEEFVLSNDISMPLSHIQVSEDISRVL